ncbi:histidine kinase [Paenibacillus xylanexedens]|uniref:histidine kinase n=1 Tax=Paenibacillus xylanexedens TaxID=528191 RepID=UPI001643A9E8|nr:histidine kinase [Paenibacillus xylanexedens]
MVKLPHESTAFEFTEELFMRSESNRFFMKIVTIFLVISLCTAFVFVIYFQDLNQSKGTISMEILRDKSGNMTLSDVKVSEHFEALPSNYSKVGYSPVQLWFKIKINRYNGDEVNYLTINNPLFEDVTIYLPTSNDYIPKHFGYAYKGNSDEINYVYPAIKIPSNFDHNQYIYMTSKSLYGQNFVVGILNEDLFRKNSMINVWAAGILVGFAVALFFYNLFMGVAIRNKTFIKSCFYVFTTLLWNAVMTGLVNITGFKYAYWLAEYSTGIGIFMSLAIAIFMRAIFQTKTEFPKIDFCLKLLIGFYPITLLLFLFVNKELGAFGAGASTLMYVLYFIIMFKGIRSKTIRSPHLITAWLLCLVSVLIFYMMVLGALPQSYIMNYYLFFLSCVSAIAFALSLAEIINALNEEKHRNHVLYINSEIQSKQFELAFIRAQMDPHFIHNTLNVIEGVIAENQEKAGNLVNDLSHYLRNIFDYSNSERYISIDEELDAVKFYVRIEQARFPNKVMVNYEIDPNIQLKVPRMVIQPLVENAIKHGIRKRKIAGTVTIKIKKLEEGYFIAVEDDGVGMEEADKDKLLEYSVGKGIGLASINARLVAEYGTQLQIVSEKGKGTAVRFIIPIKEQP